MKRYFWVIVIFNIKDADYVKYFPLLNKTSREARSEFREIVDSYRAISTGFIGHLMKQESIY